MNARTLAPAKINLHLEIKGIRPDGYHNLVSIFLMTSLADEMEIISGKPGAGFSLSGRFSCATEHNLITRAVNAFCMKAGIPADFCVRVNKKIPEGAGLGGGSSDAAAVLRMLSALFPERLSSEELLSVAVALGSDVPFFLFSPAAVVSGRGERVAPIQCRSDFAILLCVPDFSVSTKEAYSWLDKARGGVVTSKQEDSEKWQVPEPDLDFQGKNPGQWRFFNSFYPLLLERHQEYRRIEEEMKRAGAEFLILSGSGSAFTGIFSDKKGAMKAVKTLRKHVRSCMVLAPLTNLPPVVIS